MDGSTWAGWICCAALPCSGKRSSCHLTCSSWLLSCWHLKETIWQSCVCDSWESSWCQSTMNWSGLVVTGKLVSIGQPGHGSWADWCWSSDSFLHQVWEVALTWQPRSSSVNSSSCRSTCCPSICPFSAIPMNSSYPVRHLFYGASRSRMKCYLW